MRKSGDQRKALAARRRVVNQELRENYAPGLPDDFEELPEEEKKKASREAEAAIAERFGARFDELTREGERRITEADVAEVLGVGDQAVARWRQGKALPRSYNQLFRLAYLLEVDVGYLLGDQREERSREKAAADYMKVAPDVVRIIRKLPADQRIALSALIRGELAEPEYLDPEPLPPIRGTAKNEAAEVLDLLAGVFDQRARVSSAEAAVAADLRAIREGRTEGEAALRGDLPKLEAVVASQEADRLKLARKFADLIDRITPAAAEPEDLIREASAVLEPVHDFAAEYGPADFDDDPEA